MGWRFTWRVDVEHDDDGGRGPWPVLVRWAVVGLAVVGVLSVLLAKGILT